MSEVSTKMRLRPPGMICTVIDNNPKLYFGLSKNSLTSKYKLHCPWNTCKDAAYRYQI